MLQRSRWLDRASLELAVGDLASSQKKAGTLSLLAIMTAVLVMYQLLMAAMNDDAPSNVWAMLSFVGFVAYLYQLAASAPATVIVLLPLLLLKTTEIGSCVAIESGALMHEIDQTGYPTGGTARLAIALMVFFGIGALLIEPAWLKQSAESDRDRIDRAVGRMVWPITFACLFFYGYFIFVGLRVGFPILSGSDRLDFKYQLSDPIYTSLLGNRPLFVTAMSLLAISTKTQIRAWVLFLGMFFVSILFGEKFTSLIVMSSIFPAAGLLVYLSRHKQLPIARMAYVGVALGALTIGTCLNVYLYIYNDFETAKTKLLDRMAEQGEMWYVGDRDFRYNTNVDWQTITTDLISCVGGSSQDPKDVGTDFGPFFVMQNYADKYVMENGQNKGIFFAFTFSTYWMMISGYGGFAIVWVLTAVAYGVAGRFLMLGLAEGNFIGALLGQKSMFLVYTAVITGYSFYVFGYKTVGIFFAAWLANYWKKLLRFVAYRGRNTVNVPV